MIDAHDSRAAAFDLNLLRLFARLLELRNLTRVAAELGVTQSAVSRSLSRLREAFDDPLLVRVGQRMEPTARAEALRPQVARVLGEAARLFETPEIDPATAVGTLRWTSADFAQLVLLPPLARRLDAEAPGIDVEVVPSRFPREELEAGRLDLTVDVVGVREDQPGLVQTPLFEEEFACLVREGHPCLREGPLTPARYAALDHVLVAPAGRPGGIVDQVLERQGYRRRVRFTVPSFAVPPGLLLSTDCIVTLPKRVADAAALRAPLRVLPTPVPVPGFRLACFWMERRRTDPLHRWFRGVLAEIGAGLAEPDARVEHPG
jgi:DNA-binding transcriptional LysR family regulator